MLWATHSGVLKIGDFEIRCHILSDGTRIFDAEDLEKYYGLTINEMANE